ncbi:bromodomain-containing protein 9 isoform X3 [Heterocephalus glaber]|uniref:Bromodomain-containing protein 9 n=1 Tax=Heterocephalus glaber TaxID=10181 RepID=A0AAX6T0Y2_HETGA|nr:bromodomain-containing protein 9 isoform X3 [Heterocephalus glaber]
MGKKHKKHKAEWRSSYEDYADAPLEKPLKLVLKVGGSEVTELSGSGHDSSYYDDRSDHERERHREKKKKKKKKAEKEKHLDDEERRKRKEEKKRKREKEHCDTEGEAEDFDPGKKVEVEPPPDRPVRACRTQPAENESTPIQQLLEHFLRQLQRKDPHGFFAFPVTDAIAPGYSMIIKHPMDFGTMKDKIIANEYKSVTEFKADFKLMCDNAMTYNRPDTVYYKLAKKILHAGFKMMSKQAALLGSEDMAVEEPVPEVVPVQVETAKKSKKPSREVISCVFEPEGNACSLTDSTAEEHVLALVEHAADEARDRINRFLPGGKMGYLKKLGDGSLLYSVVNVAEPDADEEETHPVDLSSLSSKLLPGFTTLGFKDERRNKVTFLSSATTGLSMQNNSVFGDLKSDEMELLYSAYGDETGVQCALSLQEFVKDAGSYSKKMVDDLLDQIAGGDHSRMLLQLRQRRNVPVRAADEVKVGDSLGDSGGSVLDFMSMKSYSDVSLDISMLSSLGKMKKDLDHDDGHLNLDETAKLLQDLHEAQAERGGSRPSSNLSSLSNASEREQHPPAWPGECWPVCTGVPRVRHKGAQHCRCTITWRAQRCGLQPAMPLCSASSTSQLGPSTPVWTTGMEGRLVGSLHLCLPYLGGMCCTGRQATTAMGSPLSTARHPCPDVFVGCLCVPQTALDTDANKVETPSWRAHACPAQL